MERVPIIIPEKRKYIKNPAGYVYFIKNLVDNKFYVGIKFSSVFVTSYWGSSNSLKADINRLGIQNFLRKVIEWVRTKEELLKREMYWIQLLNTYLSEDGYNLSEGGKGGNTWLMMTEEQRSHVIEVSKSERNTGKFKDFHELSQESSSKISNTMKQDGTVSGENNPCYNKLLYHKGSLNKFISKDEIEKYEKDGWVIGMATIIKDKILQIDKDGVVIQEINDTYKAILSKGFTPVGVKDCCKGKQKTHKGYMFMYKRNYHK